MSVGAEFMAAKLALARSIAACATCGRMRGPDDVTRALDAMAGAAGVAGLTAEEITRTIRSAQRGRERRPFTHDREADLR